MKTLIIIPAKNAYEHILDTVANIESVAPECDVLVVDYGSTDRTKYLLKNNDIMHLEYFVDASYNSAVSTGLEFAFQNGYDCAIQWDQDNKFNPEDIHYAVRTFQNKSADFVLGSRYIDKRASFKHFSTRWLRNNIRIFTGKKISDPRLRFRLYGRDVMKLFKEAEFFDPGVETVAQLARAGYKYEEIQVDESNMGNIPNNKGIINITRAVLLIIFTKPFKRRKAVK